MAAALRDAAAASEGAVPDSHPTIAEGPRPVTRLGGPAPPISEPPEDELDSARTEVMAERPNGDAPSLLSIGDASGELTALQPPPADRRLVLALGGAAVGVLALGILLWGGGKAEDAAPPRRAPAVASPEPAPQPTTRVKVTSEPLGAEVLLGDRLVGATPIVLTPEGSMGEQVVYRVRTWGHLEDALRIHIDGGEQAAHVKLIPIPPKPRPKRKRARPAAESPAVFSPFPAPPAAVPAPPAAPPKLDLPRRSLP